MHVELACALGCDHVYVLDKLDTSLRGLRTGGDQPLLEKLLLSSWWNSGPSLDAALQERA